MNQTVSSQETFMRQALDLACQAREKGNHPFGALLVHNDKVILKVENSVSTSGDVTQHAELNLVSQASKQFSKQVLAASVLYTSTEPCAMCAGAIYWSGIRKVVFGLPARELGKLSRGSLVIDCHDIFKHGLEPVTLDGPVLLEESKLPHQGFWNS